MDAIREKLFSLQDESVQRFAAKLLPTIDPERIIGVRIPLLRATARAIYKSDKALCYSFLEELPHAYVEEDLLHMMLIGLEPNAARQIELLDRFLPFADNWCVTDALSAKTIDADRLGAQRSASDRATGPLSPLCRQLVRYGCFVGKNNVARAGSLSRGNNAVACYGCRLYTPHRARCSDGKFPLQLF